MTSKLFFREFGFGKQSMAEIVQNEFSYFSKVLEETKGEPVETKELFNVPVVNAIWIILTGIRFEDGDKKLEKTIKVMDKLFADFGSILGFLAFVSVKAKLLFEALGLLSIQNGFNHVFEIAEEQIEDHISTWQEENMRDFTDCFIKQKMLNETDEEDKKFAKQNLRNIYADLFLAGSETTSTTLRWAMLYMILNPEIQLKVQVYKYCSRNKNYFNFLNTFSIISNTL